MGGRGPTFFTQEYLGLFKPAPIIIHIRTKKIQSYSLTCTTVSLGVDGPFTRPTDEMSSINVVSVSHGGSFRESGAAGFTGS